MIPVDFRLVAATNRNLSETVKSKGFRLDLLYRLEVVKIRVPPLRERIEDIPHLARHFLSIHSQSAGRSTPELKPTALKLMLRYSWPGNVRELQNEMWRSVAFGHVTVRPEDLSDKIRCLTVPNLRGVKEAEVCDFYQAEQDILGAIVQAAIRQTKGNCAEAARLLGLPKTSFYRKMRRYQVNPDRLPMAESFRPITHAIARYRFLDRVLQPRKDD